MGSLNIKYISISLYTNYISLFRFEIEIFKEDSFYSDKYISSRRNMKDTKRNSKSEFGHHKTCIMCFVLFIVVSLSESCNSAQKDQINQDRQSRALQRNSENCDVDLPYSSYQS